MLLENQRIRVLKDYCILDTKPEPFFDHIVQLAASIAGVRIAALSFIDAQRQWIKAKLGLQLNEISRDVSFDAQVVLQQGPLRLSNLRDQKEYLNYPIIHSNLYIHCYTGIPLVAPTGEIIGVLSLMNQDFLALSDAQIQSLEILSKQTIEFMEVRKSHQIFLKSEQRFKAAIEGSGAGFLDWNTATNETFFSDTWKSMLDYSAHDIDSHIDAWRKLIHPDDFGGVLKAIQDYFHEIESELKVEHRLRTKSGEYKWVLIRGNCLREKDGAPIRMTGWFWDLTEKKAQEIIAREQHKQFMRSQKMASLGVMAGGIAHEINNPIAIISGNIQQLRFLSKKEPLEPSALVQLADRMDATVQRVLKIVRSLRNFSKDDDQDPFVPISVRALIEETLVFCQDRLKEQGVHFFCSEISPDFLMECRPISISQVLLNLLNNAVEALEESSEKWIRIEVSVHDDVVDISVIDSGPGIPEAVRHKLMTPFFTTKAPGKGTGLGLSLSKKMIESHGGTLLLDSAFPPTKFTIRVPKTQGAILTNQSSEYLR